MQKIGDIPNTRADSNGEFTDGNVAGGVPPTILPAEWFNTIQRELISVLTLAGITPDSAKFNQVATAVAKLITDGGFLKTTNNLVEIKNAGATAVAATLANLGLSDVAHLPQLTGVVGTSRNAKMSVSIASVAATFTADELIVQEALGGRQYKLSSFNKLITLTTTGAGGMDTGAAPANGYVALYAIYNPTTQASALLAVNATSVAAPEICAGVMPAGYTASALVSVWPTTASGQFIAGILTGRDLSFTNTIVVNSSSAPTTSTALSLTSAIPLNATVFIASSRFQAVTGTGVMGFTVSSDLTGIGRASGGVYNATGVALDFTPYTIKIITRQQCYYYVSISGPSSYVYVLYVTGYSI